MNILTVNAGSYSPRLGAFAYSGEIAPTLATGRYELYGEDVLGAFLR